MAELRITEFYVDVDDATHAKLESGERIKVTGMGHHHHAGEVFFIVSGGKRDDGK